MTELFDKSNREILEENHAMLTQLLAKKKPKPRTAKKYEYPDWFEALWREHPKRAGSNPKRKAYSAANTRADERDLSTGQSCAFDVIQRMLAGVKRYARYCAAMDIQPQYVMQAATFFGPDKHYENDWTIPKKKPTEDPDKQHHPDFDANADTTIGLDPVNPYEDM